MQVYNQRVQSAVNSSQRRTPKQERAAARREALLHAAAELFAEKGYGGATMTEIAQRAGAAIGTLYEYFPDKGTLANALASKYTQEGDLYWAALLGQGKFATPCQLAEVFVDGMLTFVKGRPSYAALLAAPIRYARSDQERLPLRLHFARATRLIRPDMTKAQSLLSSRIQVELLKALLSVHSQVGVSEREDVAERFKDLVASHLARG